MSEIKILLVEDDKDQQEIFKNTVEVFNRENDLNFKYEIAEDTKEASDKIDSSFDGAIIDLFLPDNEEGGNEIVRELNDSFTRIPIIFVTALADSVIDHPSVIKKRRRQEGTYKSDLLLFQKIHKTGLTHIMGGRGIIEKNLSKVFLESLLPQIDTWASYGNTEPERTEKALLRYTLNHLFQLLEEDEKFHFPEEVYLHPPIPGKITAGSIVKENVSNQLYVVLSPACDLVIRSDGKFKTDRILLVKIEQENNIVDKALTDIMKMSNNRRKKEKVKEKVEEVLKNNYTYYYHWLPKTDFFEGGFLNFRKLMTLDEDDLDEEFGKPFIQVSPPFVKDIVSRFSSFYARQGQPNIESTDFVTCHLDRSTNTP